MDEITRVRNLKKGDSFFYNGIEFVAERFISAEKVVGVSNVITSNVRWGN